MPNNDNGASDFVVNVFQKGSLIGSLRYGKDADRLLGFQYDSSWLDVPDATPISDLFPLTREEFSGKAVDAFFENFLPEGDRRRFIQMAFHISTGNTLRLLAHFGGDTAGDLTFLPAGQELEAKPRYHQIPEDALNKWFYEAYALPAISLHGERARASLSGMQAKVALFVDKDGNFFLPVGDAPSSHIIKPAPRRETFMPEAAINEALVMGLAKAIGMNVPETRFLPQVNAFMVERYDRKATSDDGLLRLNQNDLCQILGVTSDRKYEMDGGPAFVDCLRAVERISAHPERDRERLVGWVVFNLAVGNMDTHAKNLSMLDTGDGWELAPFYDLFCTTVYQASTEFAFRIGGEFRPEKLTEEHWERFAADVGMTPDELRVLRKKVCARIGQELPAVCDQLRAQAATREQHERMVKMVNRVERKILHTSYALYKEARMGAQAQDAKAEQAPQALAVAHAVPSKNAAAPQRPSSPPSRMRM